jgi:serine/threonine-protein kinase RsbW
MQKSYQKIVKSNTALIPEATDFVFDILSSISLNEEVLNNLSLAISEALANAMVHGNKLDPNKNVVITVDIFDKKIELSIKDSGQGFKPEEVPDPTKPENILRDSGRGIFIMQSFVDDLYYSFSEEGTELKLVISTQ